MITTIWYLIIHHSIRYIYIDFHSSSYVVKAPTLIYNWCTLSFHILTHLLTVFLIYSSLCNYLLYSISIADMSANNNHNSNTFTQYTFILYVFIFNVPYYYSKHLIAIRYTMYRWLFEYVSISAGLVSFSTVYCCYIGMYSVYRKSVYCFVSWTNNWLAGSLRLGIIARFELRVKNSCKCKWR